MFLIWRPFDETQGMLGAVKIQILKRFLANAPYRRGRADRRLAQISQDLFVEECNPGVAA